MTGLTKLGVDIKLSTRVISTSTTHTGQTEVVYSDDSKVLTDLYVPTFGVVPNSSYIPRKLLNASGFAIVDEYLKVKGANDIWAVGDVTDIEWAQWIYMNYQGTHVTKNLVATLKGMAPTPYKPSDDGNRTFFLSSSFPIPISSFSLHPPISTSTPKLNTTTSGVMGFSIGPRTAAGAFGSFKLPTVALAWGRKELYTPNTIATTNGSFIAMGFRYMMN